MVVMGIMGSPRVNGTCSKLLRKALDGAAGRGAETKCFDLITHDIKYCRGCTRCFVSDPELQIGRCSLKDDMALILAEYVDADGYIFATPVYGVSITALMKTFYERMIALTYRARDAHAQLPRSRVPANFQRKASFIVTGNSGDDFKEVMGDPCFDAFQGHLMIQMVDMVDRFYAGGVETMTEQVFSNKSNEAYAMGGRLVDEIEKSRSGGCGQQEGAIL
jgi:multimeric flavodoxin WrbA